MRSGRELDQHQQRSGDNQPKAQSCLFGQALLEHQGRKADGHQNAQLVNGHHHAGEPILQGLIAAQPGAAGGQARENEKDQLLFGNGAQGVLLPLDEYNQPRHNQHHAGADGCGGV